MKWINAERQVTVTIYDEEHEEHLGKTMTVEEMLDTYTNEGCPTIYINPERKTGKWIPVTQLPELDEDGYSEKLLLSFSNFSLPTIGEYRKIDGEGFWYDGDDDKPLEDYGLKVNAWMPLPERWEDGED